jgi:hypothetical protein
MFEIHFEGRVCNCEINAKRIIALVFQAKLVDRNRTQERRIDLVDINSEALLSRSPRNPPTHTMRNGEWRKPDRQQCCEQNEQPSQK